MGGPIPLRNQVTPSGACGTTRSATGHPPALRCAIDSFGADRILLGTDFPYEDGDTFVRAVDYVIDVTDPGEAHAILDANAMALFRLA